MKLQNHYKLVATEESRTKHEMLRFAQHDWGKQEKLRPLYSTPAVPSGRSSLTRH